MRLVHGHFNGFDPRVAQTHVRDSLRQGLDQVDRVVRDSRPDFLDEGSVVNRVMLVVALRRIAGVHAQDQIHHELLSVTAFDLEHAVVTVDGKATHGEAVVDLLGHRASTLPAVRPAPERPVQPIAPDCDERHFSCPRATW